MCYVCNCFAWSLDLIQRAITFCLACCIACVVGFGLVVTILAGIAYGYNYSLAEFITFSKSDVTVYMRRGQFHDNPDLVVGGNRRTGDGDDELSSNIVSDYEERDVINKESEPLSDKWLKDEDAREYAMKLTKYSGVRKTTGDEPGLRMQPKATITSQQTRQFSIIPTPIPTTIWRTNNSQIVMRKFLPLNEITEASHRGAPNDYFYSDNKLRRVMKPIESEYSERQLPIKESVEPDFKTRYDDISERYLVPISDIPTNLKHVHDQDDLPDDEVEYNLVYKPV